MVTVVQGVKNDLAALGTVDSSLAAAALVLAAELDKPDNSATSKSMCAQALLKTMEHLRSLAPPRDEEDQVDDLSSRRAQRLAGGAAP
jgi:hypothetical protein